MTPQEMVAKLQEEHFVGVRGLNIEETFGIDDIDRADIVTVRADLLPGKEGRMAYQVRVDVQASFGLAAADALIAAEEVAAAARLAVTLRDKLMGWEWCLGGHGEWEVASRPEVK